MKKQKKKEVPTSTRLLAEIRHLHPELKFCGEPKNAILKVPDALLNYVLSLLRNGQIQIQHMYRPQHEPHPQTGGRP